MLWAKLPCLGLARRLQKLGWTPNLLGRLALTRGLDEAWLLAASILDQQQVVVIVGHLLDHRGESEG